MTIAERHTLRPRPWRLMRSAHAVLAALILAALLVSGCAKPPAGPQPPIADLLTIPQDANAFLDPVNADMPLIPGSQHAELTDDYLARYYSPWQRSAPETGPDKVFAFLNAFDPDTFYSENKLRFRPCFVDDMRKLADPGGYPNLGLPAIATVNTDMRVLPTERPIFRDFARAGEGFPFDYNQNTAVWAQTPLFVSHISSDGAWALVETHNTYGWLPIRDIAMVDDEVIEAFTTSRAATIISDRVPVADGFGVHRFAGRIGTLVPLIGGESGVLDVLLAVRDDNGRAVLTSAELSPEDARPFPLSPTPANFARLANEIMGQPYGWGGMYGNRDCSAMIMDMYAAMGIWQPRNSTKQANNWPQISLEGLERSEKLEIIRESARPWLSLLWKAGHIMIYIGEWEGRPAILHTTWGLKTKVGDDYGRHIIGGTVITSLEPGIELPELARPEGSLLHVMRALVRVAPGEGN